MKLNFAVCLATLFATTLLPTAAFAKDVYRGQGYTVTIGNNGSYYGCDSQNRCLSIPNYFQRHKDAYSWKNKGFTYILSPIVGRPDRYSLEVVNPQSKIILLRKLVRMGVGG
jgi:hypothetical protein